jgi:hypothetical protein
MTSIEQKKIKRDLKRANEVDLYEKASIVAASLPSTQTQAMLAAQQKGASALVTTLPLQRYGFDLTKTEFRDQVLMRYRWPLHDIP